MRVQEYIGVYHADGGLVGETKYFFGHLFRTGPLFAVRHHSFAGAAQEGVGHVGGLA